MLDILDSSTLSIVVGIMWAISLLLMFSIWRINRNVPGLPWWLAASAMSVIGFLFGIQTFHALGWPVAYGYVVNNTLSMTAGLFILSGTLRFRSIAPLPRAWMALPVLFACGSFWLRDQTNWRYLFMDSIGIMLMLASAWAMLRGVRPHERLVHTLVATFLLLFALALAGRLVMVFGVHDAALLTRQGYQKIILLSVIIFAVGWSYGISLACYLREHHALRAANARAEESSQAKSALVSTVSHELRAPLHDILGYAQLLARQVPPQARDQLAIIQDSGNQLLHLINDLLAFSRGEVKPIALEPAPLSLSQLAADLGAVYRPRAARGDNALLVRVASGDSDWVMADEQRLTQVLRNLLENACKFTQDGYIALDIAVTAAPPPRADARADRGKSDCLVTLRVTDTGIGIPAAELATIFQPFKRLDRDQRVPGLGLGLVIARQLATAMGGRLRVLSRQGPDHGTTFSLALRLPRCPPQDTPSDAERIPSGYRGRRLTLLIADDATTSRQFLADCCAGWGFRVILARDGAEAVALFNAAQPPVDAALVDQFMPHLDGWGFLRAVRETDRGQALPVVLISAAAPRQRPEGFPAALQFARFAMKPLSQSQLACILGEVLGLVWDAGEDAPTPVAAMTWSAAMPPPCSDEELGQFRDMVALGQLMAIRQWALEMTDRHPQQGALWQGILQLCTSVDLPGLQRLAGAWSGGHA